MHIIRIEMERNIKNALSVLFYLSRLQPNDVHRFKNNVFFYLSRSLLFILFGKFLGDTRKWSKIIARIALSNSYDETYRRYTKYTIYKNKPNFVFDAECTR